MKVLNRIWRIISSFGIMTIGFGGTFFFCKVFENWLNSLLILQIFWYVGMITGIVTSIGFAIERLDDLDGKEKTDEKKVCN